MRTDQRIAPGTRRSLARHAASSQAGLPILALLLGPLGLASAQSIAPARSAIRMEQVVAALSIAKLSLENGQVSLLAQNTASIAEPRLEVRGVEPWGARSARVRLRCEAQEQCVPFFVAVSWADAATARAAMHLASVQTPAAGSSSVPASGLHAVAGRSPASSVNNPQSKPSPQALGQPKAAAGVKPGTVKPETVKPGAAKLGTLEPDPEPAAASLHEGSAVRVGSHATLLIDGQRLHIRMPVICLENGAPGRTIRVTALDHKQSYLAEVIDSTLLKLTL